MTLRTLQTTIGAIHEKKKFDIASIMAAANSEVPRSPAASNSGSNSDQEANSKNDPNSPEVIQRESSERGSSPHSVSLKN